MEDNCTGHSAMPAALMPAEPREPGGNTGIGIGKAASEHPGLGLSPPSRGRDMAAEDFVEPFLQNWPVQRTVEDRMPDTIKYQNPVPRQVVDNHDDPVEHQMKVPSAGSPLQPGFITVGGISQPFLDYEAV